MYEYYPWSKATLKQCISDYKDGKLTILDLELSGACNFKCKYCDSPDRDKGFNIEIEKIETLLREEQIRWIFICGLGEPTFGQNYEQLIKILKVAERNKVKCSIFSNLSNLTKELLKYIDDEVLYILFKLDSFRTKYIENLYGTKSPNIQLDNINELIKHVILRDGCTNLAASIVPNKNNKDEIPDLVAWCSEHNVFPLIAELEQAGNGKDVFDELSLSQKELATIKLNILLKDAEEPRVPICPAMISGVHINHQGEITVDRATGFSCHWFWLKNPAVEKIGSINDDSQWADCVNNIIHYRLNQTKSIKEQIEQYNDDGTVFGGCGGAVRELLLSHLALHGECNE